MLASTTLKDRRVTRCLSGACRFCAQRKTGAQTKQSRSVAFFMAAPINTPASDSASYAASYSASRDRHLDIVERRFHILVPVDRVRRHDIHVALADAVR